MEEAMSSDNLPTFSNKLHEAALAGDANAQVDLALCYSQGWGVEIDHAKAVHWYTLAAEQGHRAALHSLGIKYMHGDGVKRDPAKAAEYWQRAADLGFAMSMFLLANCYQNGDGVPEDSELSYSLYERAAKLDYPPAMLDYGMLTFFRNLGTPLVEEAYRWLLLAYEMGISGYQNPLLEVGRDLSPETKKRIRAEVLAERDRIIAEGIYLPGDYSSYEDEEFEGEGDDDKEAGEIPPPPEGLFTGGDGSSFEQAVKINESRSGFGASYEYYWLNLLGQKKGLGWTLGRQRLAYKCGVPYDILEVIWSDGSQEKVYFDISAFFGQG